MPDLPTPTEGEEGGRRYWHVFYAAKDGVTATVTAEDSPLPQPTEATIPFDNILGPGPAVARHIGTFDHEPDRSEVDALVAALPPTGGSS
jgi:hypothetical protein